MSGDRCERCDKPPATQEDHDDPSHPGGCTCDECCSKCWGNGVDCSPVDWRERALAAERDRDEAVARAERAEAECGAMRAVMEAAERQEDASQARAAAYGGTEYRAKWSLWEHAATVTEAAVDEWRRTRQSKEQAS